MHRLPAGAGGLRSLIVLLAGRPAAAHYLASAASSPDLPRGSPGSNLLKGPKVAFGLYVSRDPLGQWGDPSQLGNAYGFVGANAVNGMDPLGLYWEWDSAAQRLVWVPEFGFDLAPWYFAPGFWSLHPYTLSDLAFWLKLLPRRPSVRLRGRPRGIARESRGILDDIGIGDVVDRIAEENPDLGKAVETAGRALTGDKKGALYCAGDLAASQAPTSEFGRWWYSLTPGERRFYIAAGLLSLDFLGEVCFSPDEGAGGGMGEAPDADDVAPDPETAATADSATQESQGTAPQPGAPAVPGDPYSPEEVSKRQSALRRAMGVEEDPDAPIPDQGPGRNIKGVHQANEGTPHLGGERNVNPLEEHSRRAKGWNPPKRP